MKSLSLASIMLVLALSACAGTGQQDDKLSSDVETSVKAHTILDSGHVQVSDGVAYLHGSAATWLQYHQAEDAARAVPGVLRVVNLVEVRGR